MKIRPAVIALLSAALMIGSTDAAHAYLDAATGTMLLQGLMALVLGLGVGARMYWHKLMILLGVKKQRPREDES